MSTYPRVVRAVMTSPWALEPAMFGTIFTLLHSKMFVGEHLPGAAPVESDAFAIPSAATDLHAGQGRSKEGRFGAMRFGKSATGLLVNHTARIHAEAVKRCGGSYSAYVDIVQSETAALPAGQLLYVFGSGVLGKHLTGMDEACSGGLSVDRIQASIKTARDDDKVAGLMMHLDTPGGICYGMAETSALVRQVRENKSVGTIVDSLNASAGYWCSCASDAIYVTPSADVGSIGVYSAFVNYVEWCKKNGLEVKLYTDGSTYKGAGYPGTSLTPEQEAKIIADVKACSDAFKRDVRAGRKDVPEASMQGQTFTGQAAIDAKLADFLVNDADEALADLAKTV